MKGKLRGAQFREESANRIPDALGVKIAMSMSGDLVLTTGRAMRNAMKIDVMINQSEEGRTRNIRALDLARQRCGGGGKQVERNDDDVAAAAGKDVLAVKGANIEREVDQTEIHIEEKSIGKDIRRGFILILFVECFCIYC